MMNIWKKYSKEEVRKKVFAALGQNGNFYEQTILGVPASHLDSKVFYQDAPFLKDAPFLSTLIHNPNHIGCHTLGESEPFFAGTQELEREVIRVCSEEILHGEEMGFDGYIASGGTEANMQAIWIYRNYFRKERSAGDKEICIVCSEDSHYSMSKAANILNIPVKFVPVDSKNREISEGGLIQKVEEARSEGAKYFIVIVNMMTTMFGSVDDPEVYSRVLKERELEFKMHVDGAYGGFYYPFSTDYNHLDFRNEDITSVTLDAHKMVQAPYGTGIFVIRKGWMEYALTEEARYVQGGDYTLIGSRSGANAVAVWMILMRHGPFGWKEKILILQNRTNWLCELLLEKGILFFRHKHANIITISNKNINPDLADKYGLVPDNHEKPSWYKIVLMEHVDMERLIPFVEELN